MDDKVAIYSHPVSGASVLPILRDHLPSSIAVYQRIQLNTLTENAHLIASFPESTQPPECFGVTFFDRSIRPETEMVLYLSGQRSGTCAASCPNCQAVLLGLLRHVGSLAVPASSHGSPDVNSLSRFAVHLNNKDLLLVGLLAEMPGLMLDLMGLIHPDYPGMSLPYIEYLFYKDKLPAETNKSLPELLRWGKLSRPAHFELVRKRTEIPRHAATLARIPSLAIFPNTAATDEDSSPIAWAFLGAEGSLSTLHVEEQWRNKGIAKMLAGRLLREGMGEEGIGHAEVDVDNKASRRVCERLGGVDAGNVFWIRVDLAKVRDFKEVIRS